MPDRVSSAGTAPWLYEKSNPWTLTVTNPDRESAARKPRLNFGRFSMPIPASRPLRMGLGVALVIGGLLGFLPILGFWMVPLGLLVLSIDIAPVRRFRRRMEIRWGRRKEKKNAA